MMEPTPDRCAQLRAHKALPRRRIVSDIFQEGERTKATLRRASEPRRNVAEITTWIAGASPTTSNPNKHLPLTPPSPARGDNDKTFFDSPAVEDQVGLSLSQAPEGNMTPINQNTPPTPELTPPQKHTTKKEEAPLVALRYPSAVSQADSFKTAREYALSENGTAYRSSPDLDGKDGTESGSTTSHLSSVITSQQPHAIGLGFGLGLDLDERHSSSTMRTLRALQSPSTAQPMDQTAPLVNEDPFSITEAAAVQAIASESLAIPMDLGFEGENKADVSDDFQASLDRAFKESDEIEESRKAYHKGSNNEPEEGARPTFGNKSKSSSPESVPLDSKRISQLSASSSAVIEAVVLDTPKRRRQKLRHCSKNASLRDAGSPISGSNRSSVASADARPRLHHKAAIASVNRNRTSLNSDSGISMGFDAAHKEQDFAPLEVPKRRSSLKSSSKDRKFDRRIASDTNYGKSSRPMTAPDNNTPKMVSKSLRSQSVSEWGSQIPVEDRGRALRRSKPSVPPRTSSLSAPTTRNQSRAASLTPGQGLNAGEENQAKATEQPQLSAAREIPEIAIHHGVSDSDDNDRVLHLRPSLTRTPFSAVSAGSFQSSTPGPIELNEATVISIQPHNNKSVLVVQHSAKKGSDEPQTSAHLTNSVTVKLRRSSEPESSPAFRDPMINGVENAHISQPGPAVMLIPPTPANELPADEDASEASTRQSKRSTTNPLSSIKRALSTRRYSDTVVGPFSKLMPSHSNTPLRRRIKIDSGSNALTPFWRPRGFWDDFSDSESDSDEEPGFVRNTLGLPQRRVVTGPVALARRLGSLKRRKESASSLDEHPTGRRFSMPTLRSKYRNGDGETDQGAMTRLRQPLDLGNPLSAFYDSLLRKKTQRDKAKHERERERLKRSIGPVMYRANVSAYN